MRRALSHALLALAIVAGCTPDFEEEWQVIDLRILAIQADPPEVLVPVSSTTLPTVQVRALVVDPRLAAGEALRWELWACTPEDTTCDEASSRVLVRRDTTPLGQIQASFDITSGLLQAATREDGFKGFGGVPVKVHLKVWGKGEAEPVEGIKRLVYAAQDSPMLQTSIPLPGTPAPGTLTGACTGTSCDDGLTCVGSTCVKSPNQNPVITDVRADGTPIPAGGSPCRSSTSRSTRGSPAY